MASEHFLHKRVPRTCFVAMRVASKIFTPRGINTETTHYLLSYFFRLNTLKHAKGATKALNVDFLRLKIVRDTTSTPVLYII